MLHFIRKCSRKTNLVFIKDIYWRMILKLDAERKLRTKIKWFVKTYEEKTKRNLFILKKKTNTQKAKRNHIFLRSKFNKLDWIRQEKKTNNFQGSKFLVISLFKWISLCFVNNHQIVYGSIAVIKAPQWHEKNNVQSDILYWAHPYFLTSAIQERGWFSIVGKKYRELLPLFIRNVSGQF